MSTDEESDRCRCINSCDSRLLCPLVKRVSNWYLIFHCHRINSLKQIYLRSRCPDVGCGHRGWAWAPIDTILIVQLSHHDRQRTEWVGHLSCSPSLLFSSYSVVCVHVSQYTSFFTNSSCEYTLMPECHHSGPHILPLKLTHFLCHRRQQGVNYLPTTMKPLAKFFMSYLHDYIRYSGRWNVHVDKFHIIYLCDYIHILSTWLYKVVRATECWCW